ncbi:MAG TPA: HEPN domain-containing protein [Clostridiales bacterium]|nr:HEPN domain-containing protein [Clostridiales bacterium]
MADSKRFEDWYKKAQADLQGARILKDHEGDNGLVAFHCQQAIEKALKGFILERTNELLEGHSLVFLCRRAARLDSYFAGQLKNCAFVNQFYIETRYPADMPDPVDDDEMEECLRITAEIIDYIIGGRKSKE